MIFFATVFGSYVLDFDIMHDDNKKKELKEKLDHVIEKSNAQKKILKKIMTQLNKETEDIEEEPDENEIEKP